MLPSVNTSRWPFTAPSVPASTFSATHGVRNPLIRNFIPVKVKSGAGVTLIWHWLHVNPVCRTNAGTRASATCATTPSAANTTATLSHRMVASLPSGTLQGTVQHCEQHNLRGCAPGAQPLRPPARFPTCNAIVAGPHKTCQPPVRAGRPHPHPRKDTKPTVEVHCGSRVRATTLRPLQQHYHRYWKFRSQVLPLRQF